MTLLGNAEIALPPPPPPPQRPPPTWDANSCRTAQSAQRLRCGYCTMCTVQPVSDLLDQSNSERIRCLPGRLLALHFIFEKDVN